MNEEQKAILASIAHWERMRDNLSYGERPDGKNCPLCQRAFENNQVNCEKCPVMRKTGLRGCYGTPWSDAHLAYIDAFAASPAKRKAALEVWKKAAQAEIEFLRSLLDNTTQV